MDNIGIKVNRSSLLLHSYFASGIEAFLPLKEYLVDQVGTLELYTYRILADNSV